MYPDVKDPADSVRIIPNVVKSSFQTDKFSIATGDWVVRYEDPAAKVSAGYLAGKGPFGRLFDFILGPLTLIRQGDTAFS